MIDFELIFILQIFGERDRCGGLALQIHLVALAVDNVKVVNQEICVGIVEILVLLLDCGKECLFIGSRKSFGNDFQLTRLDAADVFDVCILDNVLAVGIHSQLDVRRLVVVAWVIVAWGGRLCFTVGRNVPVLCRICGGIGIGLHILGNTSRMEKHLISDARLGAVCDIYI